MDVVLDANALIRDYRLRGRQSRRLVEQAEAQEIAIYVPEVVLDEVLKHFRADLQRAAQARETSDSASSRVLEDHDAQPALDIPRLVREYEEELRQTLADAGAEIVSPEVSHGDLGRRAVARHKPFKKNGAGYQDALVWELVRERACEGEVVLISDNKEDFGGDDDGGLDPYLVDELAGEGLDGRVTRVPSIPSFAAVYLANAQVHEAELAARLENDDGYLAAVRAAIEDLFIREGGVEIGGIGAIADDVNTTVETVEIDNVGLISVTESGDGDFYASLEVTGELILEFPMLQIEAWSALEDGTLDDFSVTDPNEHFGDATMRTRFEATVDADYVPDTGELRDWEISWSRRRD